MDASKNLSAEAASEIASLAKRISVAQELDGEIQVELRGHIEDKVRGYLCGTVKVSETDALILAKAHFGDAAVIKAMFQGVHARAHRVSLIRRLAAVFVLSTWVWTIRTNVHLLWEGWFYHFGVKAVKSNHVPISRFPDVVVGLVLIVASLAFLWRVLAFWKARANCGHRLWFEIWSPLTLGLIVAGSVLCSMGVSNLCYVPFHEFMDGLDYRTVFQPSLICTILDRWVFPISFFMAIGLLWIWWCDHTPRRMRTLLVSGIAWLITYQVLLTVSLSTGNEAFIDYLTIHHLMLMLSNFVQPFLLMNLVFNVPLLLATVGGYVYYTRRRPVVVG